MHAAVDPPFQEISEKQLDPQEAPPQELKDIFKSWSGNLAHLRQAGVLDLASMDLPYLDGISQERYLEILRLFMKRSSPKALELELSLEIGSANLSSETSQLEELPVTSPFSPEESPVLFPDDLCASIYRCRKIPGRCLTSLYAFPFYGT